MNKRLFEAIVEANQRAAGGEATGLRPDDFADSLPIVALTCIDPRLDPLMPEVLGIAPEHFIWLRNAGNIVTGSMSSTMRSIALACAVKGGREIVVIGHTDCRVRQTSASDLIDRFRKLGIDRSKLPDNVQEFFGLFASERSNVMKAVEFVRQSPLMGASIPVHGLMVDTQNGRLEWIVNGYNALAGAASATAGPQAKLNLPAFNLGEMKFPDMKIGEAVPHAKPVMAQEPPPPPELPTPPMRMKVPQAPPIPPRILRGQPRER